VTPARQAAWAVAETWWIAGKSAREIAAMVGVTRIAVYMHAQRHWAPRPHLKPGRPSKHGPRRPAARKRLPRPKPVLAYRCSMCFAATATATCNVCGGPAVAV